MPMMAVRAAVRAGAMAACLVVLVAASSGAAAGRPRLAREGALPARPRISDYHVCFGRFDGGAAGEQAILRSFVVDGQPRWLVVDPRTLHTAIVEARGTCAEAQVASALDPAWAGSAYGRALADGRSRESALADAGLTHVRSEAHGISLTVDLCPSRRPLDRRLFLALLNELGKVESPVPVAVAVTGEWMDAHAPDLEWLAGLDRDGQLAITWINHSYHHPVSATLPLRSNFLLEPGTDVRAEVLDTERALIERGLVPSVFFRFPGLVSSAALVETVIALGLVPVGSDAWLAKGQRPADGSVVLVHGNGNEPLGVRKFITLLQDERAAVQHRQWLLLDLRDAETAAPRIP
jgi:hypothetical protein